MTGLLVNLQRSYARGPTKAPEHASTNGSMKSLPLRLRMLHSRIAGTSFNSLVHILPNQHEAICSALSLRKLPFRHAKSRECTMKGNENMKVKSQSQSEPAALPRWTPSMPCRIRQSLSPSKQLHEQSTNSLGNQATQAHLRLNGS